MEAFFVFVVVLLCLKKLSPVTSLVLDLAAILFTPEIPKMISGLKHFTQPLHQHNSEMTELQIFPIF